MSKQYFQKESTNSRFIVAATGKPVQFEILDGNQGVIVLDDSIPDQKVIAEALAKSVGSRGIVKLNESEYNALKKKHPYNPSKLLLKRRQELISSFPTAFQPPQKKPGVVAAGKTQLSPSKMTRASMQAAEQAMAAATVPTAEAAAPDPLNAAFKPATGRAKATKGEAQVAVASNV